MKRRHMGNMKFDPPPEVKPPLSQISHMEGMEGMEGMKGLGEAWCIKVFKDSGHGK